MGLRDTFLNMLGGDTQEVRKTSNSFRGARDFLKYGNREQLTPQWSDIKMSDKDMYRGYSYAVIQKRGNKVASLAKANLKTFANKEIVDEYQKNNEIVYHPYLTLIEDSTRFTEKQFWKNISIYLDLAGRYYLGVVRNEVKPIKEGYPTITTDIKEFIMLNPYEIRRVINKDNEVAGYIERKKDGRYREWPLYQIIEMKELNPFDPDKGQWAMTDAAKEAVFTLNQSGDYTRQSMSGNIDAPGIITTDVILNDEDFANFRSRVQQHKKGEPLFGNGAGAIQWESMQVDLDKAALLDINEINRTTLFAVSGTSKTSLGIEQSGTTRETARVQTEQFISDTAQPRLEDIIDFLNLDYKKHYPSEYKKTGYLITVESAVGRDYATETQATQMRQTQVELAMSLIQAGYTTESAYQYAQGEIELQDLELEKGVEKPSVGGSENPQDGSDGQNPTPTNPSPEGGSNLPENNPESTNELDPNANLDIDNPFLNGGKGSGNFGHAGRKGKVGGSASTSQASADKVDSLDDKVKAGTIRHKKYSSGESESQQIAEWEETDDPIYKGEIIVKSADQIGRVISSDSASVAKVAYTVRDKRVIDLFKDLDPNDELDKHDIDLYRTYLKKTFKIDDKELDRLTGNTRNQLECKCENGFIENQVEQSEFVKGEYDRFLEEVREIEAETINKVVSKVEINAFELKDIIGPRQRKSLTERLKGYLNNYWLAILPFFATNKMNERNTEFNTNEVFTVTNGVSEYMDHNAVRVAEGHMDTILTDILGAANNAYDKVLEDAAAGLIIEAYDDSPTRFEQYFQAQPTRADALAAIQKTDILEKNKKIYEKANKMAFEGYSRRDIIKAIREEYKPISENRASLIARNETSRAYTRSQYEADKQFLTNTGKIDQAYKVMYSRRANKAEICPYCAKLIADSEKNPVPFETPFLEYGNSISVVKNGETKTFTANYESIEAGVVHPNCQCGYRLVFKDKNGDFVTTLNGVKTNGNVLPSEGAIPSHSDCSCGSCSNRSDDEQPTAKSLNGGKGSGNFGHAGRPGKVGGSAKTPMSEMRTKSFMKGDQVKGETTGGEKIEGTYLGVAPEKIHLSASYTHPATGEEIKWERDVTAAQIQTADGKIHEVPFMGKYITMVKNVDAPDTKPSERRTEKQKKALDGVFNILTPAYGAESYLRNNCAEDTAEAILTELKKAQADGVDLSGLRIGKTQSQKAQARIVWKSEADYANGGRRVVPELQLSAGLTADGENYKKKLQSQQDDGWHTGNSLEATIRHELGHYKAYQALIKHEGTNAWANWGGRGFSEWKYDDLCAKIVREATGNSYRSLTKSTKEKKGDISEYGYTNAAETVAEAYSNADYSKATKAIAKTLDKYLKDGYKLNSTKEKVLNENREPKEIALCSGYPFKEDWEALKKELKEDA